MAQTHSARNARNTRSTGERQEAAESAAVGSKTITACDILLDFNNQAPVPGRPITASPQVKHPTLGFKYLVQLRSFRENTISANKG